MIFPMTAMDFVQRAVAAITPWLAGMAVGLFVLSLIMRSCKDRPFEKELKWFFSLTPWHKFIVVSVFCFFTLWGGSKERGILPSSLIDGITSTVTRVVETVQPRTLPDGFSSNVFFVADFSIDSQWKTAAFEVAWASNSFENVDSRNVDVFMSTNLSVNGWFLLGSYLMPTGTNSYVFTITSNDIALAYRPLYVDSFDRMAFFRFGLDFDSDGDGLTDAYEDFVSHTDPLVSDTDGDGMPDGWEDENGLDPDLWSDAYADSDGDGIPNLYEYHHGTHPQVPDAELVERIIAGGAGTNGVATLAAAIAASRPYSVIEVVDGVHEGPGWAGALITLPEYPVLITSSSGGRSRRAIIRHTEQLAAMYLNATQTTHTVVQGICYDLAATNGTQMAFWCGGNLPWSGAPAGGMFRDIYVRMPNPDVKYRGWFFRHWESNEVVIASCTVNAYGATNARGVYAVDSPPMSIENCTFVNFPSNDGGIGYGIQYESTVQNWGGAPSPIPLEIVNCLFDASFTNACALAPLENGVAYDVSMINCIVPSPLVYEADFTSGLIVTNAGVSFSGHIQDSSPARGAGVASLYAPLDIDGQDRAATPDVGADQFVLDAGTLDIDGDGLSDFDENWLYGSDPFFADSDWDGSPDAAEVANGTDPLDRLSHFANITLVVTNIFASASVTNYFGFSRTATGWDVTNVCAMTHWGLVSNVVSTTDSLYGKAFSDLNRNGIYDEDEDVIGIVCFEDDYAIVSKVILLGDIDGDGVYDAMERNDGTDPYDGDNFRMRLTVHIINNDRSEGITNYLAWAVEANLSPTNINDFVCANEWVNDISIGTNVIDGNLYLVGYRDVNMNRAYDSGIDVPLVQEFPRRYNQGEAPFVIGDADNDGVPDSEEIREGCDPTDRKNYFVAGHLEIEGVFATTNLLLAQVFFGTNSVIGPVVQGSTTSTWDIPRLVTTNGETLVVRFWDDANGDRMENTGETHTYYMVQPFRYGTTSRGVLHLGQFDVDGDGIPDWWTQHWNLHGSETDDDDDDGIINLHEYWLGSCPTNNMDGDTSSALYVMANSIDQRLLGRAATLQTKARYMPYTRTSILSGNAVNTNCWTDGIDVTSVSPWNSWHAQLEAGTAISRRHVAFAKHFIFYNGVGTRDIYFVSNTGEVHTNRVMDVVKHPQVDIAIGLLENDLPSNISVAKILPGDYCKYILDGRGLPVLSLDQEEHAIVHDIGELSADVVGAAPSLTNRAMFTEEIIVGDSGNPRFLVLVNEVVLLNLFLSGRYGSGPSFEYYKEDVQEMMDMVSRRNALEPSSYRIEEVDLSSFSMVGGRELSAVLGCGGGD